VKRQNQTAKHNDSILGTLESRTHRVLTNLAPGVD
jgi:hypothetical protein